MQAGPGGACWLAWLPPPGPLDPPCSPTLPHLTVPDHGGQLVQVLHHPPLGKPRRVRGGGQRVGDLAEEVVGGGILRQARRGEAWGPGTCRRQVVAEAEPSRHGRAGGAARPKRSIAGEVASDSPARQTPGPPPLAASSPCQAPLSHCVAGRSSASRWWLLIDCAKSEDSRSCRARR